MLQREHGIRCRSARGQLASNKRRQKGLVDRVLYGDNLYDLAMRGRAICGRACPRVD